MYTTNTATARIPQTYTTIRADCEKLLEIAVQLEGKALNDVTFLENPDFQKLKELFRERYILLSSLAQC